MSAEKTNFCFLKRRRIENRLSCPAGPFNIMLVSESLLNVLGLGIKDNSEFDAAAG